MIFQLCGSESFCWNFIEIVSFFIDERETIEMNAGACSNAKCTEFIDFDSIKTFASKCRTCDEPITRRNYQRYQDVMSATRHHLDSLKMSDVACKKMLLFENRLNWIYLNTLH